MILRSCHDSDIEACVGILWRQTHANALLLKERFASALADKKWIVLVAEVDSIIAGVLVAQVFETIIDNSLSAYVEWVVVDDVYRKRGIGSALMLVVEAHARNAGCNRMSLDSLQSSKAFHEKMGYVEVPGTMSKRLNLASPRHTLNAYKISATVSTV
jgi:GNAT superfamily N-acetyltransferase